MLYYPKIPGSKNCPSGRCIAFEKYDGTNLHWSWNVELGWHSFGTRRTAFDLTDEDIARFHQTHPGLEDAPSIFRQQLAGPLAEVFQQAPYDLYENIRVFTEYLGPNSFAGKHVATDAKELRLLDVECEGEGEGMLPPEQFVADFAVCNPARVVYRGKLTGKFAEAVRDGAYDVAEGVICKGVSQGEVWMVKIKTYAYLQRLKEAFSSRWEDYWE